MLAFLLYFFFPVALDTTHPTYSYLILLHVGSLASSLEFKFVKEEIFLWFATVP